jgi:hypothetical protein
MERDIVRKFLKSDQNTIPEMALLYSPVGTNLNDKIKVFSDLRTG